jgi:vesicle transport protein SEC22
MIEDGICYLTLTDKSYPKRLAFLFLEDVAKEFVEELKREHGDRYT